MPKELIIIFLLMIYYLRHIETESINMFYKTKITEFPPVLRPLYKKALYYEWISLFYMISATIFSFLVMANSQTMKTIWLEDFLGIITPLAFLISSKIRKWPATKNFPYGFHEIAGITFLINALVLFLLGLYLFCDGLWVLLKQQHTIIPDVQVFNHLIWLGYIMILALLWSSIPSTILGHIKIPLANKLYDKTLYADAKMNKASWLDGFASIIGIIFVGMGFWWADATFAMIISLIIIKDGFSNLKQAFFDLINQTPKILGQNETDPLFAQVKKLILSEAWIQAVKLRFRDEGHVFFGEIFIETKAETISVDKIITLQKKIEKFHWRLHDIVIMPIKIEP